MAQKHIKDYFSPSNFPPKRKREGEPPVVENRKKQKSAEPTATLNVKKRIKSADRNPVVKRVKLSDTREKMEKAVEDRNDLFNERCTPVEIQNPSARLSLETINVNSLIDPGRLHRMKSLLKQWENDVTVMVDTRIESKRANCMRTKDYDIIATNKPFRGVIMQIHKRLDPEIIEIDNENANYIATIINTNGKRIGIVGIYGPNNDDPKFYKDTLNKVLKNLVIKTDDIILAGDFNISLSDSVGNLRNGSYNNDAFAECVRIWNLKDIIECKAKKNDIKPLTYIHTTKNNDVNKDIFPLKAARLDGIFTTIDTAELRATIGKFYPSDHASVRAEFPESKDIGKKVWKLNVSQLRDELLVERWKKIANNLTETNEFLRVKLESEYEITNHRMIELLGKDALKKWNELLGIIKAMSIEENNAKKDKMLTRQEIKVLEKEELNDILDELNKNEAEKTKIRSELKNYDLNATNKKLIKHKGKLENQSRNISNTKRNI